MHTKFDWNFLLVVIISINFNARSVNIYKILIKIINRPHFFFAVNKLILINQVFLKKRIFIGTCGLLADTLTKNNYLKTYSIRYK